MNFKTLRVCLDPKLLSFSCAKCFLYVDVSESAPLAVENLKAPMRREFGFRSLYLKYLVFRLKMSRFASIYWISLGL
jgi:hypothetical protein